MADYIKSKGIAGVKLSQSINEEKYRKTISKLETKKNSMLSDISDLDKLIEHKRGMLSAIEDNRKDILSEVDCLKRERESVSMDINEIKSSIPILQDKYNSIRIDGEQESSRLNEVVASVRVDIQKLQDEYFRVIESLGKQKIESEKQDGIIASKKKLVDDINKEYVALSKKHKESLDIIDRADSVRKELNERKRSLDELEHRCDVRKRSLERMYAKKLGIKKIKKF